MTRHRDEEDSHDRDPEEPDDFDRDDDPDGTDTEPCPFCKREIHADTDICPHCGNFIIHDERPSHYIVWVVAAVAVLLAMGLMVLARGGF